MSKNLYIVHAINIISGLVFLMAVYILSIPGLGTEDISKVLEWVFLITMPNFDIGSALMDMYSNSLNKDACAKVNCTVTHAEYTFGCCPGKHLDVVLVKAIESSLHKQHLIKLSFFSSFLYNIVYKNMHSHPVGK